MAIFHAAPGRGRIINLVLQDAKGVWVRADEGVAVLEEKVADRFRRVAHLYGYVEQDAPKRPAVVEPVADTPAPAASKSGK